MTSIALAAELPAAARDAGVHARQVVRVVEAYWLGTPEEGDRLLAPLRALGPVMDTVGEVDAVGLLQVHMDPPSPVPGMGDHQMLERFDEATISRVVEVAGQPARGTAADVRGPSRRRRARPPGRGLRRARRARGEFMTFTVGILPVPEHGAADRREAGPDPGGAGA